MPRWSPQHPRSSHWWYPHCLAHRALSHPHRRCSAISQVQGHCYTHHRHWRVGWCYYPVLWTLTTFDHQPDGNTILATHASRTKNQGAIDMSVVQALGDTARAHFGIKLLDFKPFNPVKRTEITHTVKSRAASLSVSQRAWQVPKWSLVINWLSPKKPAAVLGWETTYTLRSCWRMALPPEASSATLMRWLWMPMGSLVCSLSTSTRFSSGYKGLGIWARWRVMVPTTPLRCLRSRANVRIAVEGATDAARGGADVVLTEPGLSAIVHAIRQYRIIFQRMRNYLIYTCAVTIRIVVFCYPVVCVDIINILRIHPTFRETWNIPQVCKNVINVLGMFRTFR